MCCRFQWTLRDAGQNTVMRVGIIVHRLCGQCIKNCSDGAQTQSQHGGVWEHILYSVKGVNIPQIAAIVISVAVISTSARNL